jgi:hypothetical protein
MINHGMRRFFALNFQTNPGKMYKDDEISVVLRAVNFEPQPIGPWASRH